MARRGDRGEVEALTTPPLWEVLFAPPHHSPLILSATRWLAKVELRAKWLAGSLFAEKPREIVIPGEKPPS